MKTCQCLRMEICLSADREVIITDDNGYDDEQEEADEFEDDEGD